MLSALMVYQSIKFCASSLANSLENNSLFSLRENLRAITPGLLEGIRDIFKDLFDEAMGAKLIDNFSELLMSSLFYEHFVSNMDIQALLATYIENVTPIGSVKARLAPLFDAFIAQRLKTK
jgi:hypothetical protein